MSTGTFYIISFQRFFHSDRTPTGMLITAGRDSYKTSSGYAFYKVGEIGEDISLPSSLPAYRFYDLN